jgi:hypothetical protein
MRKHAPCWATALFRLMAEPSSCKCGMFTQTTCFDEADAFSGNVPGATWERLEPHRVAMLSETERTASAE